MTGAGPRPPAAPDLAARPPARPPAAPDLAARPPAGPPVPRTLAGRRVRLVPLDPRAHAGALLAAAQGPGADPDLWRYLPYGPFAPGEFRAWLEEQARAADPVFLTVVDAASSRPGGLVAYMRIEPAHACLEIGHIWFGPGLQRTPQATEAIFLLLHHAFEDLGYRRIEWKCNAANARSRRAADRFGFTFEGVFRQHMIVKGASRDTAWYSLLDREWPFARAAFRAWLDPDNFDENSRQRRRLGAAQSAGSTMS